jgi:hypothetical protein
MSEVELLLLKLRSSYVGQSALYCACRNGHNKIVIELINTSGIDVNVTATPHGGTPLHGIIS